MSADIQSMITQCDDIIPNKLTVKGDVIRFSDALKVKCPWTIKQIDILATDKVLIDSDFISDDGFQLNIVAENWEIVGSPKITLDGKKGQPHPSQKAKNGEPGLPGLPGGAAGNFYGIAFNFINSDGLTISANGGEGGPGQDGGDGVSGERGKDVNLATIQEKPSERRFFGTVVQKFLVKGTAGQIGGNGGDGGKGGLGGPSGVVSITSVYNNLVKNKISVQNVNGDDGPDGAGGAGGYGGMSGNNCRVTISRSFFFWVQVDKQTTYTWIKTREIAPSGRNGLKGINGQDRSARNIPKPLADTMIHYEKLILEKDVRNREYMLGMNMIPPKSPGVVKDNAMPKKSLRVRKKREFQKNAYYEVVKDVKSGGSRWEVGRAIADGNSKDDNVATPLAASFDLNSNLMFGQLFLSKMFGITFQNRTFLSPEQERLVKVRELEAQILPFLDNDYMP